MEPLRTPITLRPTALLRLALTDTRIFSVPSWAAAISGAPSVAPTVSVGIGEGTSWAKRTAPIWIRFDGEPET